MNKELVSIIVPVYNAEKFIESTINNVLRETYQNFELLLVDDLSTDNSYNIIKKFKDKRIKYIKLEKKGLASGARNRGIKEAQGTFICFLDADDFWEDDKLEKQIKFMKEKNCAFSFTGYEFTKEDGTKTNKKVFIPNELTYKQALKNTTIFTSTVMFDMNKISKNDIYMPNVKSEDTACWWNILKKGYKAYGLNEILSYYRRSDGTLSSDKVEAIKRIWNLYRNYENLNFIYSFYNFIFYAFNAVRRRL